MVQSRPPRAARPTQSLGRQVVQNSVAQQPREPFLRSKSGRAWFLLLGLALLSSVAAGAAHYRSSVHWFATNKAEETATALRLVQAVVANYTELSADMPSQRAPVPAAFRAHTTTRFKPPR